MFATTCRKCQLIRIYLGCAFVAILLIGLRPEQAQKVAGLMPSPMTIGMMIMLGGSYAFYRRLKAHRAEMVRVEAAQQRRAHSTRH
ncbi:hypothetical protein [Thalassobius sp. Cn5-15]|jgi:hypothetical protein|uniref:hypothetical protein n=1 Tax=Thalassobius sp. Cn5-15 TaxID=2917763 RepID=UPI001EF33C89|nr:hypothetical protein [Thalassobius sp. Cn5-15]MCG7492799.1 hypothetical protein [Thalassobius sp. Cn5-15]